MHGRIRLAFAAGPQLANAAVPALALFAAANLLLGAFAHRLSCNWLWIGLDDRPLTPGWLLLAAFAVAVLAAQWLSAVRMPARLLVGIVALICLRDAIGYYRLVGAGVVRTSFPLPLSAALFALLAVWTLAGGALEWKRPLRLVIHGGLIASCAGAMLLAQMLIFGASDYRRPADAIVAFGAGVRPDGWPSRALAQRTTTAIELYKQGLADVLVFSGGPNPNGTISEPQAMRTLALDQGVPGDAIIVDEHGLNTMATVQNTARLARRFGWRSLLMVSHDFHLSRISMTCRRAGLTAYTVPAKEDRPLTAKPYFVQRELAAWLFYYLRGARAETRQLAGR